MPEAATGPAFVATLVDFGRQLRAAGVAVGSGDVLTYCAATAELNPADLLDLYWAGRTTLAHQRDDLATYDRVFREFFLGEPAEADERRPFSVAAREEATAVLQLPETEPPHGSPDPQEREARLGLLASDAATLKRRRSRRALRRSWPS